ncbi:MAG: undecaprenyldiphospho-muramoylpentapeptide beta-N-acetylglucosaminyltransferase [Candidatus Dactylopiibacterium carminicum]|uniref:UDP-N-acetylglucosamine--N-acetylmuramyl-(pentapeptide) pyrophosphoryl-undecaprenol N-acetylglucosamine transferase n=1 Tax=Candidatus Dactylopiibacterium carminicum TaxID=857335 RepID=A0A272EQP5_9RHOO|nr:undecaprenyldiphospho-muramoylpentapeptide beta-N-acetylglucosaminyltransferase [Candidatus Dactylopiibacterium carminicum]KAF7599275.1 undecaprenyldiphospho-muramoylpentapeptide beta-N-acetylglucosaminyltransferase [Candidatus Dactylopiibacterium carminicum]PAS92437.1 MAG: undecaprenyldiphospho-muramoylpentapeptide beta-N-acetylglucosaminyltransferase [Candidatus Dactylopiibacterium carminicum]PAS97175.1 MAG: undecaprenyldiphospho-muramoylpentapeptide beta-N-acetylglucosaminyltransferase [Ca
MPAQRAPKLLVMAGGTGGHIYPGVAVAETLRARGWQIAWLGNEDRMEGRIVPAYGYELAWIRFGALRGKGLRAKLLLPLNLLRGFWQAWRAIHRVQPDVVLGMGGYVSFPGGMMASLQGRPLVVHEQNSVAGLSNRVLAGVADAVLAGFPDAIAKARHVGNPVREDIAALPAPTRRFAGRAGPLRILVVGGSLGAEALNRVLPEALAKIPAEECPVVTHQSGERQIEALRAAYAAAGVEGELLPFIGDMARRYAEADLVICRAGALTVAELAAAGVASILVPFPHAVDDHQTGNARYLADKGAALLLPQAALTAEALAAQIRALDRDRLLAMAEAARALARPEAAAAAADCCEALARRRPA